MKFFLKNILLKVEIISVFFISTLLFCYCKKTTSFTTTPTEIGSIALPFDTAGVTLALDITDAINSTPARYDASINAKYKELVGGQVLQTLRINSNVEGVAKLNFFGNKNDGTLAIAEYWIMNTDDGNFFVTNTLNDSERKTALPSQNITLKKGLNVLIVKTTFNMKGLIAKGTKIGARLIFKDNIIRENSSYVASNDKEDNMGDKLVMINAVIKINDTIYTSNTSYIRQKFAKAYFNIVDKNKKITDVNPIYPTITNIGFSTKFFDDEYSNGIDWTNNNNQEAVFSHTYDNDKKDSSIIGFSYDKPKNHIDLVWSTPLLIKKEGYGLRPNRASVDFYFNVKNISSSNIELYSSGFDLSSVGTRFINDPEIVILNICDTDTDDVSCFTYFSGNNSVWKYATP